MSRLAPLVFLFDKIIYGQAGVMQRQATRSAARRFFLVSSVVVTLGVLGATWLRMNRGAYDDMTTAIDPRLEDSLRAVLEGRMWPEDELVDLVAPVPGWDTLIALGPKARHGDLGSLVDGAGFLVRERLGRLLGHTSATAPVRLVAIRGGESIVADIDLSWGTGYSIGTRLKREGWLMVQRSALQKAQEPVASALERRESLDAPVAAEVETEELDWLDMLELAEQNAAAGER